MNKRMYNLIYAIYFWCFGPDEEYEDADSVEYASYALEMLEKIQEHQLMKLEDNRGK